MASSYYIFGVVQVSDLLGQSEARKIIVHLNIFYLLHWLSQTEWHANINGLWYCGVSFAAFFVEVVVHSLTQNGSCVIVDGGILCLAILFNVSYVKVKPVSTFLDTRWRFPIFNTIWSPR